MVHERKLGGKLAKGREIHGESNVWSTAHQKKSLGRDVDMNEAIDQLDKANSM